MERTAVSSSTIASVGYEPETFTLEVEFHSGGVYQYFDVPQAVVDEFMSAASLGSFLARVLRNEYRYAKL